MSPDSTLGQSVCGTSACQTVDCELPESRRAYIPSARVLTNTSPSRAAPWTACSPLGVENRHRGVPVATSKATTWPVGDEASSRAEDTKTVSPAIEGTAREP